VAPKRIVLAAVDRSMKARAVPPPRWPKRR
jgi:hypothetical protein